jgi:hydrogenase nickel incorporation protein HypA/HybF
LLKDELFMHELSIALSLLDVAAAEAAKQDGGVTAIHVRVGALSGVVREALSAAWEMVRIATPLEQADLMVEEIPIVAYCRPCESEQNVVSPQWLRCSRCGGAEIEILRGRELELIALEVET